MGDLSTVSPTEVEGKVLVEDKMFVLQQFQSHLVIILGVYHHMI